MTAADVVVIGAGPAGMAAAIAAGDAGAAVTVVDDGWLPGGQYHRQPPPQLRARPGPPIVEAVQRHPRIELRQSSRVWRVEPGDGTRDHPHRLLIADLPEPIEASRLVIATGAHDRPLPFPGWDLPGVMTAGGVQAMLKASDVLPGRRVVVAGTGPFIIAVGADLSKRGTEVVAVLELRRDAARSWARSPGGVLAGCMAGKAAEGMGYLRTLRRHGVPIRLGYRIAAARSGPRGEVAEVDVVGPDLGARPETVATDVVAIGYGFTAALELPVAVGCELVRDSADGSEVVRVDDDGRTSVPGVFAAGEITGVGGADLAAVEGRLAGMAALGVRPPYWLRLRHRTLCAFARALRRAARRRFGAGRPDPRRHRRLPVRGGHRRTDPRGCARPWRRRCSLGKAPVASRDGALPRSDVRSERRSDRLGGARRRASRSGRSGYQATRGSRRARRPGRSWATFGAVIAWIC